MVHQTHHLIYQHICAPLHTEQCGKIIDKEQKNFHGGMTTAEGMEIQKQLSQRR